MPSTKYEVHVIGADGTGEKVLAAGGNYGQPYLADSTFIVSGIPGMYTATYAGSTLRQLYPGTAWGHIALSIDRTRVVVETLTSGMNDVYIMNPDGTNLTKCSVSGGHYTESRLSPLKDELVFRRDHTVCFMHLDGSNVRTIDSTASDLYPQSLLYIDENRVLYSVDSGSVKGTPGDLGTTSIVLYDKLNGTHKLIVAHHQLCYFEQNAVRGDTVLCIEQSTMKLLNVATGTITTLGPALCASYSPDGTKIVSSDERHISILDLQSGTTRVLYTQSDASRFIIDTEISPDNKFVVFLISYTVPD